MDSTSIHYADERDWQDIMKNRSRLKMHELIERLGLRAKWSSNKRGKTNFDSPLVKDLVNDMTNLVATLPKETDELIAHLATPDSIKTEVDLLLNKHGLAIWGRMGDREHLVSVGEPEVEHFYYPRDLYFENEEDRELIRVLLHWWIGLKACNVILARDRLDRERKKKEERLRQRDDFAASPREPNPTVPIAPAAPSEFRADPLSIKNEGRTSPFSHPQRVVQALRLDTSYSNPISPISGTPLHSNDSPVISAHTGGHGHFTHPFARDLNGSRRPSALSQTVSSHGGTVGEARLSNTPPLPSMQQLSSELGSLVSNFLEDDTAATKRIQHTPPPASQPPTQEDTQRNSTTQCGLDVDTLNEFRSYIYPGEDGARWDEDGLLRHLETAWRESIRTTQKLSGYTPLFVARDRAFLTWIELRRHLADLDRADKRWCQPNPSPAELESRIVQHKTLMSASRDLVRSWEDIGTGLSLDWAPEGLSADDLLVQAFVLLAGENANADMIWAPMNVAETVRWLRGHFEAFLAEEREREGMGVGLLYLKT